ncbi:MAG: malto-oligosyltrehalose synthase [Candidatus Aminicenantes bacterium]
MTPSPLATYRLQLHPGFGFKETAAVLDYLELLGISDIYASPVFKARPGSRHGYDIVDPLQVNPQLGGEKGFLKLASELQKRGLGWIQDIVPNHMAFHPENSWLMDVFEKGRFSPYFSYFDIDWDHPCSSLKGRLLAPFLGKFYGEVLEAGELKLTYEAGRLAVNYHGLSFPLRIESLAWAFARNLEDLKNKTGEDHPDYIKFLGALLMLESLKNGEEIKRRDRPLDMVKELIWELYRENSAIRAHMERSLKAFNHGADSPVPFQPLNDLLNRQFFRLSFWKVAMEEINYRRFFNINDLISLRMENPGVFTHFHSLVVDYIQKGFFTGLRVDHIDGLHNPEAYLKRLRKSAGNRYIVIEKILEEEECLPGSFPVEGTTGYDWMNRVNQIFCCRRSERRWEQLYSRFTGLKKPFPELAADKKRLIIGKNMAGDIDNLARCLKKVSERHPSGQDFTLYGLKRALVEILARFPVYRTYSTAGSVRDCDRKVIRKAVGEARRHIPDLTHECAFIQQSLLMEWEEDWDEHMRQAGEEFALRFQQVSGPVMAKGFEDTVLYVYNRLISLNEVGGNPERFGSGLESFHEWNRRRQKKHPLSLNASATHDNKRGEDVRPRIHVLSEIPEEWERNIKRWRRMNLEYKRLNKGSPAPDANDEYFLYQTLIGTYPFESGDLSLYRERIKEYLVKSVREAKVHTAWLRPDQDYEQAFVDFFEKIMRPDSEFIRDFVPFQSQIAGYGIFNSLSQVFLKMTLSGVPDFYQGCEFWDFNLVDPDNRRPVDFRHRYNKLCEIIKNDRKKGYVSSLWKFRRDGGIKLYLIWKVLRARKNFSAVFEKGEHIPLKTTGRQKNRVIVFMRRYKEKWILAAAPRFLTGLVKENQDLSQADWGNTRIILPDAAPRRWEHVFAGEERKLSRQVPAGDLFTDIPVSLCISLD